VDFAGKVDALSAILAAPAAARAAAAKELLTQVVVEGGISSPKANDVVSSLSE